MKIISLNVWNGRGGEGLLEFFRKYFDVDALFLQEVTRNATHRTKWFGDERDSLFDEFNEILISHNGFFAPAQDDEWGLATFVDKSLNVLEQGDIFVYKHKNAMVERDGTTLGKNLQYTIIEENGKTINLLNFHGLWNGKGKSDTEDRISQSKKIIDFVKGLKGEIVLMGDFNLRPDTQSLKMIESELGLRNLISEFGVTSTRTSFYKKEEKFADYTFVSPNIKVKDFKILPEEVSDHAAMFLEIE